MTDLLLRYGVWALIILLILLVLPVVGFVQIGWPARRQEVLMSFVPKAIRRYFAVFYPRKLLELKSAEQLLAAMANDYHKRFGRQHYVVPMLGLLVVAGFSLLLAGRAIRLSLQQPTLPFSELAATGAAAIAGAYIWVIHDLIGRFRRCDLYPCDLGWCVFRFVVVVPVAFAFAAIFKDPLAVPLAVLLGAFPTQTLFAVMRRVASSKLNLLGERDDQRYQLEELQGIGREQAMRFEDEGIRSVLQLAYCDPVELTIRTNFSLSYVVDCCSQALAWLYFEGELVKLRRFGLRGGQEIGGCIDNLLGHSGQPRDVKAAQRARQLVERAAEALKMDTECFENALNEIATDPYVMFLREVWQSGSEEAQQASEEC